VEKPFSQACENNKEPILAVLREHLGAGRLLEIGSGTGQHAAWLPTFLPGLEWQPSDIAENLPGIRAWLDEGPVNVHTPLELDADSVRLCIGQAADHLRRDGLFLIYGPFCYNGTCADSNARFDATLRERDPSMGLRDYEWIEACMGEAGLTPVADHAMPANNRILVFRRN
jgi:hypothetical protein